MSLPQPGAGWHALPRFLNVGPAGLHLPLWRRARGGGQRDGLRYRLQVPSAREKQAACPVPAAWRHGSPQRWGQCLPAPRRAVPGEALQHPGTDTSVVHPCPAEGTRMLRPSRLCRPRGGKASCQAGCSIQFALISQSASGSHAPKPISATVAGPKGALPLPYPGLGPG